MGTETSYWIGVASKDHVQIGLGDGICQLCHGKAQPLRKMSVGDWIIYYSPKDRFEVGASYQKFTAIGEVVGTDVYQFEMFPGFVPFRRNIRYVDSIEVPIRPLLEQLSFIKDKTKWGSAFRFGYLKISKVDFELIASQMLGVVPGT
jgi:hypothetical protein